MIRSSRHPWPFLFCSRIIAMYVVFFPSLMVLADKYSGFCAASESNIAAANNAFIGAVGVLLFRQPYSINECISP